MMYVGRCTDVHVNGYMDKCQESESLGVNAAEASLDAGQSKGWNPFDLQLFWSVHHDLSIGRLVPQQFLLMKSKDNQQPIS